MGQADLKKYYSVEEYFELEQNREERHEFYNGEIFAMTGANLNHNRLIRKIGSILDKQLKNGCEVLQKMLS